MVLWRVLLRTPLREANVTAALYDVSLFLFKVLKVSFDRTLVAEPTLEALFENRRLSPHNHVSAAAFQFGISRHVVGAEPPAVEHCR